MSNFIILIIGMILIGVLCYFIGLRRGIMGSQHLYEDGWRDADGYFSQHYEKTNIDAMMDDLYKEHEKAAKSQLLIEGLDDLVQPEEETIVDCGEY